MHAIKGGWVGQTFALAKSNESEGRKSRIRRSKEERKAMVESFIKKYQKLNNGSFPSLNLTHKEVGGSFYTVREIVRDIIQENRVLGPAKLTQEKQSTHQLEQDPLGSIALEPQHLSTVLLNGPQFVTNEYQIREEPSSVSGGHQPTPEHHTFDNWQVIDGTQIDTKEKGRGEPKDAEMPEVVEVEQNVEVKQDEDEDLVSDGNHASPRPEMVDNELTMNGCLVDMRSKESGEVKTKESHELIQKELQVNEASKAENAEEQSTTSRSKVTPIAGNVQVETFPVRPISGTNELDGRSGKVTDMANSFGDQKVELVTSAGSSMTGKVNSPQNSRLLNEKEATKLSNPPSDKHCGLMDEEVVEEQLDQLLESSNCSNEGAGHEIQDLSNTAVEVSSNDVASVTSEQSSVIAGAKAVNAPNGMKKKYADHGNGTIGQSKTEEELIEKESDVQQSGHPQKESSPTLDRINLESWDGASKNSGRPRGNPLWAVFKAFVDAFVKFWSE